MADISSANAVYMLAVAGLYPTPVQLQGFSADDIFDTEPLDNAELRMGVDGVLSSGFIFVPVKQSIMLQADSASNDIFDLVYATEQQTQAKLVLSGTVILPSIGRTWNMPKGFLTTYSPLPDAKKVLEPRKYGITWQSVSPAVSS